MLGITPLHSLLSVSMSLGLGGLAHILKDYITGFHYYLIDVKMVLIAKSTT